MNIHFVPESCPIEKLVPYIRNPRKNDAAVDRMASAIQEYGLPYPILARSDGQVIDGHLRLKAAKKLGLEQVPVIWCDEWTPEQVKKFRLLVNRSATWAEWDEDLLALELADIRDLGLDLACTGFEPSEIDKLLFQSQPAPAEVDAPWPLPEQAVTVPGDLWLCGEHRILCGDATSAADVGRTLESKVPFLMITDPPYGVEYEPQWREQAGLGRTRQNGKVVNDDRCDWTSAFHLFSGAVAYVWHAGIHASEVARSLVTANFDIRSQIIWAKQHFVLSRGHYHWQHEPCWYAVRRGSNARWCGDRDQSTLWETANLNPFGGRGEREAPTGHGTQKPVELQKRPILNHTRLGEAVYDPFLGSGTTVIAAETAGRVCYGLEIEPAYVDVAVLRWQAVSGKAAVLAEDGRTFDVVADARRHA